MNGELPHLGQDTLETRAAQSNQIWEARQRARRGVVDQFETIDDPERVPIGWQGRGELGPTDEFLGWAEPQEAAHQLDPLFPRQDLGPQDVERDGDEFRPTEGVRRQSAAYELEERTPLEDVDPFGDLVPQGGGFGLAEPRQREAAALELDPEYPEVDLGPGDVEPVGDGRFGLRSETEREIVARRFEERTPLESVDPERDLRRSGDEFELTDAAVQRAIDRDPEFFR